MSSAAPPDAISASSAGTGNKKKNKNNKKPKKAVDTGGDHCGAADQQQPSPNPRDGNSNEVSAAEDEPDTPAVSPATAYCTRGVLGGPTSALRTRLRFLRACTMYLTYSLLRSLAMEPCFNHGAVYRGIACSLAEYLVDDVIDRL